MKTRFDLEQEIMNCWCVVEDVKAVAALTDLRAVSEDEMQNMLLGIQALYQAKFEHLWDTFEKVIANGSVR